MALSIEPNAVSTIDTGPPPSRASRRNSSKPSMRGISGR
jgi:hypothetical protein